MSTKRRTRKDRQINIASSKTSSFSQNGSKNDLCDTSEPLFTLYSEMVEDDDNKFADRYQKDADGILVFIGLFSATLATLISVTIQDLRPTGPQDGSPFSPPTYSIWVNSLWISGLTINIASALLATLIQQWARRYNRITQPPGSPHKRARIRQYIFNDDVNSHFLLAVDLVPSLLHLSVFLFFAGLLILLRHISHTVFNAVVGWVVLCAVYYVHITLLPIFRQHSPYYSPISSLAYQAYANIRYSVFEPLSKAEREVRDMDIRRPAARLLRRLEEEVRRIVSKESPSVDALVLESLVDNLDKDVAREKFLEALPGFYDSKVVKTKDVNDNLSPTFFTNFRRTINEFSHQTFSSDSVPKLIRSRRLHTCLNATQSVLGGRTDILRDWCNTSGSSVALIGNCTVAQIIATAEKRDDTWMALVTSQLGVTEEVLRRYLKHGDSVLLANLIKTTRLIFENDLQFQDILRSISQFSVKATLPELQQDFCTLWDEIVEKNKHSGEYTFILDEICDVHAALHPTAPMTVAPLPTPNTTNNDGLKSPHALCADPQSRQRHHPSDASRQVAAIATSSSSSPLGAQSFSPPLQRDETNISPHHVSDTPSSLEPLSPLREPPIEIRTHVPPALGYSYSTTTSYTLATPRDVSVSDPGVIVVASERDVQDLNPHNQQQSDSPARDISMHTSRPGKDVV